MNSDHVTSAAEPNETVQSDALTARPASHLEEMARELLRSIIEVEQDNDDLQLVIARCRNAFPIPQPGTDLDRKWLAAMSEPGEVAAYVQAQYEFMRDSRAELLEALQGLLGVLDTTCDAHGWERDHIVQASAARAAISKAVAP